MPAKYRLLALAVVAAAGALLVSAPARAVETTTWGIVAAPGTHGYRATLSHSADGSTVHDAVIVFNRSNQPIAIELSVLGATFSNGAYQFTSGNAGLAGGIHLAASTVRLGPHQQARVEVTIRMPRRVKGSTLAAIAAESAPINDGALVVQQRLVVLIKATPGGHLIPNVVSDVGPWAALGLLVLLSVLFLGTREWRTMQSTTGSPAAGHPAPGAAIAGAGG